MVRTRIAPSPTGFPHIGTIYQVLFDYVYARQHDGKFIMRVEDTDRTRFVEGAEDVIYKMLDWFSLNPDESPKHGGEYGPYRQSERLPIYRKYVDELINKDHAYYCFCTKERLEKMREEQTLKKQMQRYDRTCRALSKTEVEENLKKNIPYVIRMKIPDNQKIVVHDLIMGDITFNSNDVDEQVLLKSDGFPTYHLAVVVDDYLMKVTHIFRGREWMPSTPKHVLLYNYFGWEMPQFAHLPLIMNNDGKGKLGKRYGHASVDYYRELGYLPNAVLNFLSNLVWYNPKGELYSLDEFIRDFDLSNLNSQGAKFNLEKLTWMNGEYIRKMDPTILADRIYDFFKESYQKELIQKTIPLIQERIKTLKEYDEYCRFFIDKPQSYEIDLKPYKETLIAMRACVSENASLEALAEKLLMKNREFFMVLRVAITGKKITPPLNESMEILGKEEVLTRLTLAAS